MLEYNVVCNAVNSYIRTQHYFELQLTDNLDFPLFCGKQLSTIKGFRNLLVENKYSYSCAAGFWKRKFNFDVTVNIWTIAMQATKETRLRLLHWKIIHNIYPTNIMLQKMKVRDDNKCSYCRDVVDYIDIFFYECPAVLTFWRKM